MKSRVPQIHIKPTMKASVVLLLSTLGMLGLVLQATADTDQLKLQLGKVLVMVGQEVRSFTS